MGSCVCMYSLLRMCCSVRLYPDFGWYAYGTCSYVNCLWVHVRVWVQVHVPVGVLRGCLLLRIIVRFSEVTFRFRDLQ